MSTINISIEIPSPPRPTRVRKRADSNPEGAEEDALLYKRPRLMEEMGGSSTASTSTSSVLTTPGPSASSADDSVQLSISSILSMPLLLDFNEKKASDSRRLSLRSGARPLSRRSSATSSSRAQSPMINPLAGIESINARIVRSGAGLRKSASSASLRSASPAEVVYADESARKFMRNPKLLLDNTPPATATPQPVAGPSTTPPNVIIIPGLPPLTNVNPPVDPRQTLATVMPHVLACSQSGVLFFTRANRLHCKNLVTDDGVHQLCKLQEIHGTFAAITCGGEGNSNVVAVGTSKGVVAIYDIQTKKRILSWTTKPVAALAWNGKILTVGYASGSIRHFDTRITPVEKMKEQALTVTRHQSFITRLEWSLDNEILASADKKGNVYCWKLNEKVPLDIGDFVQRRKKIKHNAAISALAWSPWQPSVLLTADVKGVIQFWKVDPKNKESNALTPAKLETGAAITGIQWSTQCKEFLTTHGYKVPESIMPPPASPLGVPFLPHHNIENTLAVWQFPSLRFVTNMRMNTTDVPIGNSIAYSLNMKVVFNVPDEMKIHACDVWGKRKKTEVQKIRRHSTLDYAGLIR